MAKFSGKHDPVTLAGRLRAALGDRARLTEKKMFGGVCFMLREHMLCGSGKPGFMFRVGKDQHRSALTRAGAKAMDINGRHFKGFIWVDPEACDVRALKGWIAMADKYVAALPPKGKR
jgi:hypothetical protein